MCDAPESSPRQTAASESSRERQFSLTSIRDAHRIILRARGRLVLGHGARESLWASQLQQSAAIDVALDLSCVNDLDAQGLGVLAAFVRHARQHGRTVSVIAASRVVQRLGELTGLDRALRGAWNQRTGVFGCDDACGRAA